MSDFKLVPVKPTEEMMRAMRNADDYPKAWEAALRLAPTPAVELARLVQLGDTALMCAAEDVLAAFIKTDPQIQGSLWFALEELRRVLHRVNS